jgi:Septum formation
MAGKLGPSSAADTDLPWGEDTVVLRTGDGGFRAPVSPAVTARQALLMVLAGLLVGGVVTVVLPHVSESNSQAHAATHDRVNFVFSNVDSGTCLNWPKGAPNQPSFVQCTEDHVFEVAESVDATNVEARCDLAVRRYLGDRYDPDSKFAVSVLWSGDASGAQSGDRHLLCGLQLPGPDNQPVPFKGKVADLDQSKVWAPGTCLEIDSATNQPTDVPVDCAAPHALEVTGAVNLAERFPGRRPSAADQDAFVKDACTRVTGAYLAPIPIQTTGLTVNYSTVSAASWSAGSRQVSCGIGAMQGDKGWAARTGSAKKEAAVDSAEPEAPPERPEPEPSATPERPQPVVSTPTTAPTVNSPNPVSPPSTTATTPLGPPPGPPPGETLTPEAPPPNVIEIPGMAPVTLPVWPPPPPPPPPPALPPPPAPAP